MTLTELLAEFREMSSDAQAPYLWSDVVVTKYLNSAVDEACTRKQLLFDATTDDVCELTVEADTATYLLSSEIVFVAKAYFVSESEEYIYPEIISRDYLDRTAPGWRELTGSPEYLIVDENSVQIVPPPTEDYTGHLEVYRTPFAEEKMVDVDDSPIIATAHQQHLYHWPLHVAYSKRHASQYDPQRSQFHLDKFEEYFGRRPDADRMRKQRENRPQVNKLW